jgi:hypothetical protein
VAGFVYFTSEELILETTSLFGAKIFLLSGLLNVIFWPGMIPFPYVNLSAEEDFEQSNCVFAV